MFLTGSWVPSFRRASPPSRSRLTRSRGYSPGHVVLRSLSPRDERRRPPAHERRTARAFRSDGVRRRADLPCQRQRRLRRGRAAARALHERIEEGLEAALGYAVPTFIRAGDEVQAIAARAPFDDSGCRAPRASCRSRCSTARQRRRRASSALALAGDADGLVFDEREVYWLPSGGVLGSPLDMTVLARTLGAMTIRTKGTIEQIAANTSPGRPQQ